MAKHVRESARRTGSSCCWCSLPAWKVAEWAMRPGPKAVTAQAVAAGRELFNHDWTRQRPAHRGRRPRAGLQRQVVRRVPQPGRPRRRRTGRQERDGLRHSLGETQRASQPRASSTSKPSSPEFQETLDLVRPGLPHSPSIPLADARSTRPRPGRTDVVITQRNTPALFGDGLIDAVPDDTLIAHMREHSTAARLVGLNGAKDPKVRGRIARLADGRLGRFGWKPEFATLRDFVKAACANELGLSNPGRPQATPLGKPDYKPPGHRPDRRAVRPDDRLHPRPARPRPRSCPTVPRNANWCDRGEALFAKIGCADCHAQNLGPVEGLYSDMLLHDMGVELESSTGYYGSIIPQPVVRNDKFEVTEQPTPGEWRTAPLWGVADSGPYLHDGRAETLEEAIALHGGEAEDVAARYTEAPARTRKRSSPS